MIAGSFDARANWIPPARRGPAAPGSVRVEGLLGWTGPVALFLLLAAAGPLLLGCRDGVEGPSVETPALGRTELNLSVPRLSAGLQARRPQLPAGGGSVASPPALEREDNQRWADNHLPMAPRGDPQPLIP